MSVIEKVIKLKGSKGEADEKAFFDSGSTYSCIQKELAEKLANLEPLPEEMEFDTAEEGHKLKPIAHISILFYIKEDRFSDEFMVIDGLSEPVIIGAKTLQSWNMKLDFDHDDVIYDPKVTKLRII